MSSESELDSAHQYKEEQTVDIDQDDLLNDDDEDDEIVVDDEDEILESEFEEED